MSCPGERPASSPRRTARIAVRSACSSGWPVPRSVAIDIAPITSAARTGVPASAGRSAERRWPLDGITSILRCAVLELLADRGPLAAAHRESCRKPDYKAALNRLGRCARRTALNEIPVPRPPIRGRSYIGPGSVVRTGLAATGRWRGRRRTASPSSAIPVLRGLLHVLVGFDRPEALDDLEGAGPHLGDVHVHSHVMLAGDHLSRATRALVDLRVVERRDNGRLVQRAGLRDGGLPELEAAVDARGPASGAELGAF